MCLTVLRRNKMKFVTLTQNAKITHDIKPLYVKSFPITERIPFWLFKSKAKKSYVDLVSVYDEKKFVGFMYLIYDKDLVYVLYLATSLRRHGYGSKILGELKKRVPGKKIFLNIEALDDTAANAKQRMRRKEFYENNGFVDSGIRVCEATMEMETMSYGGIVTESDLEVVLKKYLGTALFKMFIR